MRRALLWIAGLALALALFGVASAVQDPRVVRYTVVLDRLPPGSKPIRIVQLSDTHGGWIDMPPVRLERIVAQVNALKPDMIVLTGDYSGGKLPDWPHIRLENFIDPFDRLRAPLGVFAVLGNHDEKYWNRWAFRRTHVRLLIDRWVDAGPFIVAGTDTMINMPRVDPNPAIAGIDTAKPVILISHEPDFFDYSPPCVDLAIAGHTHGGQIVLPIIGAPAYPIGKQLRGKIERNGKTEIISSGIGTTYIPVRIGVPPEIAEITLVPPPIRPAGSPAPTDTARQCHN